MARIQVLKAIFSLLVIATALILLTLKYPSLTIKQYISSKFVAIIIILYPIHSQFCHSQVYSQCLHQ